MIESVPGILSLNVQVACEDEELRMPVYIYIEKAQIISSELIRPLVDGF